MATYIKRALALDAINHANDCDCFKNYDGYSMTFDMIDEMPSADVQKVKYGKWEKAKHQPTSKNFICSACYGLTTMAYECTYGYYRYCPNCGAKMDLKE